MTSQSIVIVISPSSCKLMDALRDLPINLDISWDLPFLWLSRDTRGEVEPGSMEYSAVTQPLPDPARKPGTFSSTVAVHITLVKPVEISTDPCENLRGFFSKCTGLSW